MAGGVLIEQRVVIKKFLTTDRTVIRHQGHLAEAARALVHGDSGPQGLLPLRGVDLPDLAVPDDEVEVLHHRAAADEGHGCVDHAVDAVPEGGGEDLLRGDVGDEGDALGGAAAPTAPDMVLGQADGQVRAQAVGVVQALQVQGVEDVTAPVEGVQMFPPPVHGMAVAGDADGGEDGVPELVHALVPAQTGEDLLRPTGDGHGGHAPGEGVGHLEAVVLPEGLAAGALGAGDAVLVHAQEVLRVCGGDVERGRAGLGALVEKHPLPLGHGVEDLVRRVEVALPGEDVVPPAHDHFPAPGGVGRFRAHPGEGGALHRGGDHQVLPFLDVQAHLDQEAGVFL